jgi:putative ABC transport system permease protein
MIRLAWKLALRDLRGGTGGLLIVLLCLGVGVAAIAGIFSLRAALSQGIAESGRAILGGDLELSSGLGPIPAPVQSWLVQHGARLSQTVDTRSILIAPSGHRLLAAARAVGPGWPLLGTVTSNPAGQFSSLARGPDGKPGLLLDPAAARTLGLTLGETVTLGGIPLIYRGGILDSPDSLGDSRLFGVKAFVAAAALAGTPLVQPGGLVSFSLQVLLPPGVTAGQISAGLRETFPNPGWRLRGAGDAAPDLARFVDQTTLFMTLLGLAALLVGGIGVANGVQAWLTARARGIATLRCLGAPGRLISLVHGLQLLVLGLPGILLGLMIGALAPLLVLPLLRGRLPLPAHLGLYPAPLLLAAALGLLAGLVFALPPLRRAGAISGAALFSLAGLPARANFSWAALTAQSVAVLALFGLALWSVPQPVLAFGFCAGAILTLLVLRGIAWLLMWLIPHLPAPRDAAIGFGLRRLHGPASSLPLMMLSAGTGLTVLVAVAEIRGNLLAEFADALPASTPSFYFIDIQPHDLQTFTAALNSTRATHDLRTMPSLRARILAIGGTPVEQFHPPARSSWPLRSDISFSYAAAPPPGTVLAQGSWWPPDYLGPPLVSMDAGIARSWGLKLGDVLTVDVLGRKFDLRIANLRKIHWQSLNLNFLLLGTPDPFAGAPATIIATVKTDPGREGDVLAAVTDALPDVTGIDVGQVLRGIAGLLGEIATAVSLVGMVALLAGGLVLVSAVAAEREARIAEAVVLKTLGAGRAQIRRAWLVEFAVAGGCAGLAAAGLGTAAAAVTIIQVFDTDWIFAPGIMVATVLGSIVFMMIFGYAATARALRAPAAARLRLETGG